MLTIKVRKADIDKGEPHMAGLCPVAIALRRATKANYVSVASTMYWQMKDMGKLYSAKLPPEALAAVHEYDKTGKMKPFEFTIDKEIE